ncbi:MAG: peptidoglycan DD-metalloendopeptidase family protein, partial [Clostridiales bacterium]|nr:peptidoglycan DD-metalloendopeptidase family protein [Clostridiales bacterium]
MRRRKAAAWILIAAFLLAWVTVPARAASSSEIRKQIQALQEQKKEIETQIAQVKAEYQGNRDEIGELMARKQVLDQEVNLLAAGIRNLNEQILAYSVLIADKQEELDRAQERYEDLREQSNQRIRAMEEEGSVSYWEVVFRAASFSDLLDRLNMVEEIAASDNRRIRELEQAALEVEQAKDALALEKEGLEDTKSELDREQAELEAKQQEADALLQELLAKGRELEGLWEEYEAQEADFLEQIAAKQTEYDAAKQAEWLAYMATYVPPTTQAAQDAGGQSSEAAGGTTPQNPGSSAWLVPCSYTMLTSPFGNRTAPLAGASTYHQGVDLGAPRGTPVYASRPGIVTVAGYSNSAGNYVQINH